MRRPAEAEKRTALLAVGGLVLGLGVVLAVFGPKDEEVRGMGLARLLVEEEEWRKALWREGGHVNERELWEIQETLAVRSGISTAGMKGLVRRAVNAKDAGYRADGHLLAGNVEVAAVLAGQIAGWNERQGKAMDQAHWLRRRADGLWRGNVEDVGPVLRRALEVLKDGDAALRVGLLEDLASWHWHRLLFRPEDPKMEIESGLEALGQLMGMKEGLTRNDEVAAWRLRGRFLLRRGCLTDAGDEVVALKEAEEAFSEALARMEAGERGERWASVQHELGVARLEQGDWAGAAKGLGLALEVRNGKVAGDGRVDVRVIERRLSERLQSLAFLAWSEVRGAEGPNALEQAEAHAGAVHGMTLPEDGGLPWIVAQAALVEVARARGERERVEALCQEALQQFPLELAGEPGMVDRATFEPVRSGR